MILLFLGVAFIMMSTVIQKTEQRVMGAVPGCDTGKWHLKVDFDPRKDKAVYQCKGPHNLPLKKAKSILDTSVPEYGPPDHKCMNVTLNYKEMFGTDIPTSGAHRPNWATYGEYLYCPPQRWLHNMEHGAIVALYHPCAEANLIDEFRSIVSGCLRKHVITPYTKLSKIRPFALVAWNNRLQMNTPKKSEMVDFIKTHALRGPETTPLHGNYTLGLLKVADIVSDVVDSRLCPS